LTAGWRIELTAPARRDLRRLDPPIQRRVIAAVRGLVADPPVGRRVKLQGLDEHRLRVGDWRVRVRLAPDERTVYPRAPTRARVPRLTDSRPVHTTRTRA
jgi:mRNA interferase RelE/StbE